jgi:hypothetical protein
MRGAFLFLALLAIPLQAQDDARIKDLIQKLDDDSFEVREKAEKDLIAIGPPAVPFLNALIADAEKQKELAEVKVRALSALRTIELAAKSRQYYTDPKLVTLRCDNSELSAVLADLEKQAGVKIDGSAVDTKAKVTLDVQNAPLFRVLDELCRGQEERSYEYRDEGVKFERSRFIACPTAYEGPFRIRIVRIKQERSTDFKSSEGQVQVSFKADWQKYLKPSSRMDIDIKNVTDDKGAALEVQKTDEGIDDGNGGFVVVRRGRMIVRQAGGMATSDEPNLQPFAFKGLSAGATRLSLQGVARFRFPLEKTDVVFEKPATADPQKVGDLLLGLRNMGNGRAWKLTLTHAPGRPPVDMSDLDTRLDAESFVALDDAGREYKGMLNEASATDDAFQRFRGEVPDGTPLATYHAMFPTLQNAQPKVIRFKFVSQVFVKSVPFALKDVPLP